MLDLRRVHNMEMMSGLPDKWADLAIVDPPYGIGFSDYERGGMGEKVQKRYTKNGKKDWDNEIPDEKYFNELFRVSKNQIICGGNYFPLPPTQCFVFWYKQNPVPNFSDGEYIWTSFKRPALCFDYRYYGNLQGAGSAEEKIHPTQKPIQLYDFLLNTFAMPGQRIIDTHLGSGNIGIACHYFGCDLLAAEISEDIYASALKNVKNRTKQIKLF